PGKDLPRRTPTGRRLTELRTQLLTIAPPGIVASEVVLHQAVEPLGRPVLPVQVLSFSRHDLHSERQSRDGNPPHTGGHVLSRIVRRSRLTGLVVDVDVSVGEIRQPAFVEPVLVAGVRTS